LPVSLPRLDIVSCIHCRKLATSSQATQMRFFSKWFGGGSKQTRLESILADFSPEMFQDTYQSVNDPDMRVPAVVSVHALYIARRFACGLREMMRKVDKESAKVDVFPFDAVAFEAAAYAHYWLIRERLLADHDEDEFGDVLDEGDAYFECLNESARLTSALLVKVTDFNLNPDLLRNRCLNYSFKEGIKSERPEETFSRFVISSIQSRSPVIKTSVCISSSLPLQLCVFTYIPIFSSSLLAECKKSAHVLYLAHLDGAL
jgi:hypothetical protein